LADRGHVRAPLPALARAAPGGAARPGASLAEPARRTNRWARRRRWERWRIACSKLSPGARCPQRRADLERLLALEGEDPAAHAEVLDAGCAFLDSPLGRRMARPSAAASSGSSRSRSASRALRSKELLVRGQIDALLVDEDVTVVDYKLRKRGTPRGTRPSSTPTRWLRTSCSPRPARVRTGVVFLRSKGAPFVERVPAAPEANPHAAARRRAVHRGRPAQRRVADDRIRALPRDRLRLHPPLPPG